MSDFYKEQYDKANDTISEHNRRLGAIIAICKAGLGMSEAYFKKDPQAALREILKLAKED